MIRNKMGRVFLAFTLCTVISFSTTFFSAEAKPRELTTAWLGEHETFIVWYAKENGWDTKFNLNIKMLKFNSGKEIVEKKRAYEWQIAALGAVPALFSILSDELEIIAIANDESPSNIIYAPTNSNLFNDKGYNPSYPELFGSPQSIQDKHIVTTKGTSAHYMLISWLSALGLSEQDIKLQFLDQQAIKGLMKKNIGDAFSLWAPHTFTAENLGLKPLVHAKEIDLFQPIVLVADIAFAKTNPEEIKDFLKMYIKGIEMIRNTAPEKLAPLYIRFYKEWVGITLNTNEAIADIKNHPVYSLDEQIKMFNDTGPEGIIDKSFREIVEYYDMVTPFTTEERTRLLQLDGLNNTYLNSIK